MHSVLALSEDVFHELSCNKKKYPTLTCTVCSIVHTILPVPCIITIIIGIVQYTEQFTSPIPMRCMYIHALAVFFTVQPSGIAKYVLFTPVHSTVYSTILTCT
jgi:hypothetical protein